MALQAIGIENAQMTLNLSGVSGIYSSPINYGLRHVQIISTKESKKGRAMYLFTDQLAKNHYRDLRTEAKRVKIVKNFPTSKLNIFARLAIRIGGWLIDVGYYRLRNDSALSKKATGRFFVPSRRIL